MKTKVKKRRIKNDEEIFDSDDLYYSFLCNYYINHLTDKEIIKDISFFKLKELIEQMKDKNIPIEDEDVINWVNNKIRPHYILIYIGIREMLRRYNEVVGDIDVQEESILIFNAFKEQYLEYPEDE